MNEDLIKREIMSGLSQVDNTLILTDFFLNLDTATRHLSISFVAQNDSGETISEVINYA